MKGKRQHHDFFVAITGGATARICQRLADGTHRCLLWSSLTHAERRQGKQFVQLLAPDPQGGFCAWKSANRPKTPEVAKALEEFVADVERRHGTAIWVR